MSQILELRSLKGLCLRAYYELLPTRIFLRVVAPVTICQGALAQ